MKNTILSNFKNMFSTDERNDKSAFANGFLLFFTILTVFVVPLFPLEYLNLLFSISISGIFFFSVLALKNIGKSLFRVSVFLTLGVWISFFSDSDVVKLVYRILNFLFFFYLVGSLIKRVSSTATVTVRVIVDAITAYLLLGFALSLIVTIVSNRIPGAYNVSLVVDIEKGVLEPIQDNIYYTFMTFTTTGYGDITPVHPVSRSLSMFISVIGQLYVAVIISMLVGKYASKLKEK
jgi:hypothetical protein